MGSRMAIAAVVLTGCGRFGFEPRTEGGGDQAVPSSLELPGGGVFRKVTRGPDGAWYAGTAGLDTWMVTVDPIDDLRRTTLT